MVAEYFSWLRYIRQSSDPIFRRKEDFFEYSSLSVTEWQACIHFNYIKQIKFISCILQPSHVQYVLHQGMYVYKYRELIKAMVTFPPHGNVSRLIK